MEESYPETWEGLLQGYMKAMLSILAQILSVAGWSIPFGMDSFFFFHPLFQKSTEIAECACYTFVVISRCVLPNSQISGTVPCLMGRVFCVPETDCSNSKALL